MTREPVTKTHRAAMTPARKRRVWEAHLGRCEECGAALPVDGPTVAYDHVIALALGGADTDANTQLLCTVPCHAKKTAHDLAAIAKAKRRSGETGATHKRREIRSAGFGNRSRKFDGTVSATRPAHRRASSLGEWT